MKTKNRKKNSRKQILPKNLPICSNCGKKGSHFVPPCTTYDKKYTFEEGFFICGEEFTDFEKKMNEFLENKVCVNK